MFARVWQRFTARLRRWNPTKTGSGVVMLIGAATGLYTCIDWLSNVEFVASQSAALGSVLRDGVRWLWEFPGTPIVLLVVGLALFLRTPEPPPKRGSVTAPLLHDGVMWLGCWVATSNGARARTAIGPFCTEDRTPLLFWSDRLSAASLNASRMVNRDNGVLRSAECGRDFDLGGMEKNVQDARAEASVRIRGRDVRRQSGVGPVSPVNTP